MATITVRGMDDGVVERLRRRAAEHNRSLSGEVREILERVAEDEDVEARRAKFLETIDRLRPLTSGRKHTPARVFIREDRDHGHRDNS